MYGVWSLKRNLVIFLCKQPVGQGEKKSKNKVRYYERIEVRFIRRIVVYVFKGLNIHSLLKEKDERLR